MTTLNNDTDILTDDGIAGSPFEYDESLKAQIQELDARVNQMREVGKLKSEYLRHIRNYFRIKNIYHSNAIEGNVLDVGETRQIVELGLTIAGKPLKDQAEAKNLNAALDYLEELATGLSSPISLHDIRQIHTLILRGIDDENAGDYRKVHVAISGSDYEPPDPMNIDSQMREFIDWLQSASSENPINVIQIAAACHAWFAQIHPFIDGNGRTARILMNLVLMRAGYPIAVITKDDRIRYYDALEQSQISDLTPFISLVLECVSETLDEYETAADEQRAQQEWSQSIASLLSQPQLIDKRNEYELWRSAMELLVNHYKHIVHQLDDDLEFGRVYFKQFGVIEFEKYLSLLRGQRAKQTWSFKIDFVIGERSARYLHWFGYSYQAMKEHGDVSLHISREESKYQYEHLDKISKTNVPALREITYSPKDELFVARKGNDRCDKMKIEHIAKNFFEDVMLCHFRN